MRLRNGDRGNQNLLESSHPISTLGMINHQSVTMGPRLPLETQLDVLSHCDRASLLTCALVCRAWIPDSRMTTFASEEVELEDHIQSEMPQHDVGNVENIRATVISQIDNMRFRKTEVFIDLMSHHLSTFARYISRIHILYRSTAGSSAAAPGSIWLDLDLSHTVSNNVFIHISANKYTTSFITTIAPFISRNAATISGLRIQAPQATPTSLAELAMMLSECTQLHLRHLEILLSLVGNTFLHEKNQLESFQAYPVPKTAAWLGTAQVMRIVLPYHLATPFISAVSGQGANGWTPRLRTLEMSIDCMARSTPPLITWFRNEAFIGLTTLQLGTSNLAPGNQYRDGTPHIPLCIILIDHSLIMSLQRPSVLTFLH